MIDLSIEPSRVSRARAMELLSVPNKHVFSKIVDATPALRHKLPGEKRAKYLTSVIASLLKPVQPAAKGKGKITN